MKKNKPRNHVALNPLLRKGGAHVRAKSGERFANRQKMLKAAREWKSSRDFLCGVRWGSECRSMANPPKARHIPSASCAI